MRSPDPFLVHRAALYPWRGQASLAGLNTVLAADTPGFCDFLNRNGLAPLWSDYLQEQREAGLVPSPPTLHGSLKRARTASVALYLLQSHTLHKVAAALDAAKVVYAVFKGAGLRERLYADPTLRPMDDLDILVATDQREAALKALTRSGLTLAVDPRNLSHEVALFDGHVHVDLHWRLFRPGRSRFELAATLLERRQRHKDCWLLDDTANLLVMLVHPAFAKHVCGPAAKLVRLVDLDRLIREGKPDWEWILDVLSKAGLRTAAWSVLYWLRTMLETNVETDVLRRLRPGSLQRRYIAYWIDHDLPTRLEGIPVAIQGAFTLALQDSATDALRATATLAGTLLNRKEEIRKVRESAESA